MMAAIDHFNHDPCLLAQPGMILARIATTGPPSPASPVIAVGSVTAQAVPLELGGMLGGGMPLAYLHY